MKNEKVGWKKLNLFLRSGENFKKIIQNLVGSQNMWGDKNCWGKTNVWGIKNIMGHLFLSVWSQIWV